MCALPNLQLKVSPLYGGGIVPAHWIAERYSESTMRRSSSVARGSLLPDRSSVPPSLQKRSQRRPLAAAVAPTLGGASLRRLGENSMQHSKRDVPAVGSRR